MLIIDLKNCFCLLTIIHDVKEKEIEAVLLLVEQFLLCWKKVNNHHHAFPPDALAATDALRGRVHVTCHFHHGTTR